jgi:hypothetical protein
MIRKQGLVTVGLGSHHAEALIFLREQMERHGTIVLEEPSVPDFQTMLNGHLSVGILNFQASNDIMYV